LVRKNKEDVSELGKLKRRLLTFLGLGYLLLGIIVVLMGFRGITGFVILGDVGGEVLGIVGVVIFLVGALVFSTALKEKRRNDNDY
jgi:predicted membrane channel-forming protein YqfA (hemolysin III family)